MSCWAVVPLKSPERCKTRLAPALTPAARSRLAREMFDTVLAAVRASAADRVLVVTPVPLVLPRGVHLLRDSGRGLDEALDAARVAARSAGIARLGIVAADLPDVTCEDVNALLEAGRCGVALAPDRAGTGTNGLCLPTSADFAFAYGPGSAQRHAALAARAGYGIVHVHRAGLAFDVDTPADHALHLAARGRSPRAWLREAGAA